jgi:hypothetical protein
VMPQGDLNHVPIAAGAHVEYRYHGLESTVPILVGMPSLTPEVLLNRFNQGRDAFTR